MESTASTAPRARRGSHLAVVVPARNEVERIGSVVSSVPPEVATIIVVDDGSDDGTAVAARATGDARLVIVRHPSRRGVGAAIATGYREAFNRGADVAVVMAGDAQMDPRDLCALVAPVLANVADYAKGDRLSWPGARRSIPLARFVGNHVLSWLTGLVVGQRVRDSQCGYTALARDAASLLPLEKLWPGYGYPNDLIARLREHGLRVRDVRVRPVYRGERSGIRAHHALFVIPWLLACALLRRTRRLPPALAFQTRDA